MTRQSMLSARKIMHALERGGFVANGQSGSHFYFWHPIKKLVMCVPIHGGDLKRSLVREILRQAWLTGTELRELL